MSKRITDEQLKEEVAKLGYDKYAYHNIARRYGLEPNTVSSMISKLKLRPQNEQPVVVESRVQQSCNVRILKSFWDRLGIKPNDYVRITLKEDSMIIEKINDKDT